MWCEPRGRRTRLSLTLRWPSSSTRTTKPRGNISATSSDAGGGKPENRLPRTSKSRSQRKAEKQWEPQLAKMEDRDWRKIPSSASRRRYRPGGRATAIPSIIARFRVRICCESNDRGLHLGRIKSPAAAKELARLAVLSESESVRESAISELEGQIPRDYAGDLIEMFHSRVAYKVQPVQGPGSTGSLAVDTPRFHLVRTYDAPPAFTLASTFRGAVGYDANGMPFVAAGPRWIGFNASRFTGTAWRHCRMSRLGRKSSGHGEHEGDERTKPAPADVRRSTPSTANRRSSISAVMECFRPGGAPAVERRSGCLERLVVRPAWLSVRTSRQDHARSRTSYPQ